MTYYESYMMAHMADLIFIHADKFQINHLRYYPYLQMLNKQVQEEINSLKSESVAFNLLLQSKYRTNQTVSANQNYPDNCGEQKPKQNKYIDKALNTLQGLYTKAKK